MTALARLCSDPAERTHAMLPACSMDRQSQHPTKELHQRRRAGTRPARSRSFSRCSSDSGTNRRPGRCQRPATQKTDRCRLQSGMPEAENTRSVRVAAAIPLQSVHRSPRSSPPPSAGSPRPWPPCSWPTTDASTNGTYTSPLRSPEAL